MRAGVLAVVVIVGIAIAIAANVFFVVSETQQAIVLQLGEPKNVVRDAGLYMKTPVVQNVIFFDKRILNADMESLEVTDKERRRIQIDAFVRYRIVDPLLFYQTLNNLQAGQQRMTLILSSALRTAIGNETIFALLSEERGRVMGVIQQDLNNSASDLGIEVADVRIRRADLPQQNIQSILDRMVAERTREANEARAEGAEIKNRIESNADRERTVILAEANKQAEIIRGEGDGERNRVYAEAYNRDPEFFAFYRAMLAYEKALGHDDTTMVIAPDGEFFKFLGSDAGR